MKFLFPNYVNIIKKCCKNPKISNENLIGELFKILVDVYIDPADATHLMQRENPIPKIVMNAIATSNEDDSIANCLDFIEDNIDGKKFNEFKSKLIPIIEDDVSVTNTVKTYIKDALNEDDEIFLYRSLIEVLRISNRILDKKINIWKKGKNEINIYYGDIFKLGFGTKYLSDKKALVIPVNTEFDTKVNDDSKYCVSSETLHGQWVLNMLDHGYSIKKINSRINQSLEKMPSDLSERIGKIIPFKHENSTFLLFAITTFVDGIATTSLDDLKKSIVNLIDYYNKECQGITLYIPLIGTGRSRVNLSNYESYKNIKELLFENQNMIQGKVNILICFKDAENIEEEIDNELL